MTWRRAIGWLLPALLACGGGGSGASDTLAARAVAANAREQALGARTDPEAPPPAEQAPAPTGFGASVGFRSRRLLDEHVQKHGAEFGTTSAEAYLRLAQALRDTVAAGPVVEVRRPDGVTTRFHRSTGSFIAFNRDGTIRTFFRPNDGEAYFRRQARRRPNP